MKKALFCILAAALTAVAALAAPKATTLLSPNGKLTVNLETSSGSVSYTVIKEGKPVYEIRDIRLVTGTETIPDGSVKPDGNVTPEGDVLSEGSVAVEEGEVLVAAAVVE